MILLAQAFPDVFGPALQPVCAALLACIALALPFVWMGERGVCPFAAFRALLRLQTWAGRIVLCLLFACGAYVCGSKPASPSARVGSAPVCAPAARSAYAPALRTYDVLDPAVAGIFGAWTNAVTNACFTGVRPGPAADLLRVAWPGLADRPVQAMPFLEFYACRDLASGTWAPVGEVAVTSTAAGMVVEVPHALLPEGAGHAFHVFGFAADSDFDGVSDLREKFVLGTDPCLRDSDGDGMPDGWEAGHGLDPRDDGDAVTDLDGDGLSNLDEYLNASDPGVVDTDGDGVSDTEEVAAGGDPADASDGGLPPPADATREVEFSLDSYGAFWEMEICGLGPSDHRVRRLVLDGPQLPRTRLLANLRKGNSYRVTMVWNGDDDGDAQPGACYGWGAAVDGLPGVHCYSSYWPERLPGHERVVGNGWVADNVGGLLTMRVDMHEPDRWGYGGGNVAQGLSATIHVLDVSVEAVRFNHDPSSCTNDAVSLRRSYLEPVDWASGEWRRGGANMPACYAGGALPTIQARFRVAPALPGLRASLYAVGSGEPGNVQPGDVEFGDDGLSDWTTLHAFGRVRGPVGAHDLTLSWRVGRLDWGEARAWVDFAAAETGPHRIYRVLAPPVEPWAPNGDTNQNPWASALEWACTAAASKDNQHEAASTITETINMSGVFRYDCKRGAPHYVLDDSVFLSMALQRLSGFGGNGPLVNCQDCSSFVVSLANLLGCSLYSSRMGPSDDGILPVRFGFGLNPFIPIGCQAWETETDMFVFHEVAWMPPCSDSSLVYDACLEVDDYGLPYEEPRFPVIPVGMVFSDGSTNAPFAYRERLARPGLTGYDRCLAHPETRRRRSVK